MNTIARAAGLSKNTVSLALRHDPQIPQKTRDRIFKIAHDLGYQKNALVSRLMTELRRDRHPRFRSSLALLNAHDDPDAFRNHPTIPTYIRGCQSKGNALGYRFDEFWLHEPRLTGPRLNKIFHTRGILGALVIGLMRHNRLPERFGPTWQDYPVVVTGVRTREPELSFACTDHYMLATEAFDRALAHGYKRPALVIDPVIDELVDHRFSAGIQNAQRCLPASRRIPPFFASPSRTSTDAFWRWMKKEKPDVICTLYNNVRSWLDKGGWKVPADIGLIQLEWRLSSPEWSGMDQHNEIVGEAAVEMVIGMIHNGESGLPKFPRATLIGATWMTGQTLAPLTHT